MTNNMKEETLLPCRAAFESAFKEKYTTEDFSTYSLGINGDECYNVPPDESLEQPYIIGWHINDDYEAFKKAWNARINPAPIPDEEILDVIGKAMIKADGCGLTIEGNHVLCSDESVKAAGNDAYGKPLYNENCSCIQSCRAILKALTPYLRHKSETSELRDKEDDNG